MSLRNTAYDIGVMLGALRVPFNTTNVLKNVTSQFVVEDFGLVVSALNQGDYAMINDRVRQVFEDHRYIYITPIDSMAEKKQEVLWALMKGGYMRWLRSLYPAQFPSIIEADNLGGRIIDERLERWGNKPKYRFLVQYNLEAKQIGFRRALATDPSFFDYMP